MSPLTRLCDKRIGGLAVRLDKYLKVSRLVKRRTLAQELCDGGHVSKNGRTAKPSTEVMPGDVLDIRIGDRVMRVRVLDVALSADKEKAASMYEVLNGGSRVLQENTGSGK